jgi:O-antigen ligase
VLNKYLKVQNKFQFGQISFYLGTLFLSSALPISLIFFLISISISINLKNFSIFKEKSFHIFAICSGIMIMSNINSAINLREITQISINQSFIGLFNWIPYFIFFLSSNIYLKSSKQRKVFIKFLIASTVPVIVSCILQTVFKIYGPFETLNGLIIWFQKPITGDRGVTGLFSNQNYTAVWLASTLPLSFFELCQTKKFDLKKIFLIILNLLILFFAIRTNSRNALLGIFITSIFLSKLKYTLIFIGSLFSIILLNLNRLIFDILQDTFLLNLLLPESLTNQFSTFNLTTLLEYPRIKIYSKTLNLISENPLLGWGSSTFPKVFSLDSNGLSIQHSHNIFFELAFNFGIPLAIILLVISIKLIIDSYQIIYRKYSQKFFSPEKAWFTSTIVILICQLTDVTYFDGKVALLIWVLLTGLSCILDESKKDSYSI